MKITQRSRMVRRTARNTSKMMTQPIATKIVRTAMRMGKRRRRRSARYVCDYHLHSLSFLMIELLIRIRGRFPETLPCRRRKITFGNAGSARKTRRNASLCTASHDPKADTILSSQRMQSMFGLVLMYVFPFDTLNHRASSTAR